MKTALKRVFALCLCLLMVATVVVPANAATLEYYNTYSEIDTIKDKNGCTGMQGMAVGTTYLYTVKIKGDETKATLFKTNRKTGKTITLTNAANGKSYFTYLGHANDMDVCRLNGYSNLFVATMKTGSNSLVRMKVNGSKASKVGGYTLKYNGKEVGVSAVAVLSKTSTKVNLLFKSGVNFFTGSVKISAKSGTIKLTKAFTINTSNVKINGTANDLSSWIHQGFAYHKNTIYVPMYNPKSHNQSIIAVYNIKNASGEVKANSKLSFRITSSAFKTFEIESCGICPDNGKLYFNTNRANSSSSNQDAVLVFKKYAY